MGVPPSSPDGEEGTHPVLIGGYTNPVLDGVPPLGGMVVHPIGKDRGPPHLELGIGHSIPLWTDRHFQVQTLPSLVLRTWTVKSDTLQEFTTHCKKWYPEPVNWLRKNPKQKLTFLPASW